MQEQARTDRRVRKIGDLDVADGFDYVNKEMEYHERGERVGKDLAHFVHRTHTSVVTLRLIRALFYQVSQ